MKENAVIEKIINNIYLRNVIVLFVLLSATIAKKVYLAGSFNMLGFLYSCLVFTVLYLVVLLHNTVLYEKLLRQRRYILYALILILSWYMFNEYFLPFSKKWFGIIDTMPETATDKVLIIYGFLIDTYVGLCFYLGFNYFKQREDALRLAYLKRELELKQLKSQLHPHFLFNALNNIYSYSLESNKRSDELVLKLSELMRAVVENSEKDLIPLVDETNFIEHYIAFEQERLGTRCSVNCLKTIEVPGIPIAPFLLFSFIENAFKHGTNTTGASCISITLKADEKCIMLQIVNSIHKAAKASTGTGIINSKRRLDLMYPDKHSLKLADKEDLFYTDLVIEYA